MTDAARDNLTKLLDVMASLRTPGTGCPWDLEQTFETIAPYTIEEAYEVADAIATGDKGALKDELGDLLLQVVYHAQMAAEAGHFDFAAVARGIAAKMVRRHPHVFGPAEIEGAEVDGAEAQSRAWEEQKSAERAARGADASALADIPLALPALTRALKLQKRAARVGFDWGETGPVLAKLREETDELEAELAQGRQAEVAAEMGDLLFTVVNLARRLGVDAETALRGTNAKFERRFRHIEAGLAAEGRRPEQADLAELDARWETAKAAERA